MNKNNRPEYRSPAPYGQQSQSYNQSQNRGVYRQQTRPQNTSNTSNASNTRRSKRAAQIAKRNVRISMVFFSASLFFLEIIERIFTFRGMSFLQFIMILLFSVSAGSLISFATSFIKNKKALKITYLVILGAISVIFSAQLIYYKFFKTFFSWDSVGMAGQLTDFYREVFKAIFTNFFRILILFIPFILILIFFKRFSVYKRVPRKDKFSLAVLMIVPFLLASLIITIDRSDGGLYYTYNHPTINESAMDFGVVTSTRLSLHHMLFGDDSVEPGGDVVNPDDIDNPFEDQTPSDSETSGAETNDPAETDPSEPSTPTTPVDYGYNSMDIDFDKLISEAPNSTIKDMHEYFSSLTPTKKNEYTGYFEGKNLIFMSLEGFSGKVIDPELTPTLYMMANNGFVFENYYSSCWGGSTATGEYANMTGMFYNSAKCLEMSASVSMPFCLGNQFNKLGYKSYAFHSNTNTYYSRDKSLPNMGYEYIAQGSGVENLVANDGSMLNTKSWPHSDYELAKVTVPKYINEEHFNIYYMTISGHCYYTWSGNKMAAKHKAEIEAIEKYSGYSENVKAYLACQLEVELMLKEIMAELDAAGKLEDTVFVMAADHYPYGLSDSELSELYGLPEENIHANIELYKNTLFLYCASMKEPVYVSTPCSAIDILPTVSNLFGIEYDSRFLAGTDIFSDTEPLVILNCDGAGPYWCWINKYGTYNSKTGFTVSEAYAGTDESKLSSYVKSMTSLVATRKKYSFQILTNNYFSYVFK